MTRMQVNRTLLGFLVAVMVGLPVTDSHAIIIRHDKGYSDYRIQENQYPAVFYLAREGNRKICAATLIHPSWAVTAAHCIGETSMDTVLSQQGHYEVTVARQTQAIDLVVIHPDFILNSPTEVDLALLRFSQPLDQPGALPLYGQSDENGSVVTIVGWGYFGIGTTGREYSDGYFRRAENRVDGAGRRLLITFDDPRMLDSDVLDLEGMPGLGDSGGPAILHSKEGSWLVGVAVGELNEGDFSEEHQGNYGSQAVYERISRHTRWINHTITSNTPEAHQ